MTKEIHALFKPVINEYRHMIIRYIINKDTLCFPEELEDLLVVKRYVETNSNSLINQDDKLSVRLIKTHIEDYGDYDYDDEYIPNYCEETTFLYNTTLLQAKSLK